MKKNKSMGGENEAFSKIPDQFPGVGGENVPPCSDPVFDSDGKIISATNSLVNITEAKKAEDDNAMLAAIVQSSEDAIVSKTLKGIITSWNRGAEKLFGYTGTEMIGQPITKIIPQDRLNEEPEIIRKIQEGETIAHFETKRLSKEGKLIDISLTISPIKDNSGNITGASKIARDITEQIEARKKIEESEERFRSLAQTLPQLVWVTDAQGNSEFVSSRWKEYSGIEPDGEKEWRAVVHPDDYDKIGAAWVESLSTGSLYTYDVRLKSKEGEYRWHTVKGVPVLDAEKHIVKWIGSFTDIHDQKIKEEKKDEFISIASHEMKTPLTTAKAYLQLLELSLDESNDDAKLYAKKASESVDRIHELISELLDVSKIRLGKLNYTITTFNFNDMIEGTVENMQLTSRTHTIIRTGKVHDEVTGDKHRLQQVVINLLSNAIKYSPNATQVFITIGQEKDHIKVSVKDKGIGIARESLKKIFDKYHRIEEHATHFQGLGIGLFISCEIIQRHHGKLWAESEPGKGSTFYFTLPVNSILQPQ